MQYKGKYTEGARSGEACVGKGPFHKPGLLYMDMVPFAQLGLRQRMVAWYRLNQTELFESCLDTDQSQCQR